MIIRAKKSKLSFLTSIVKINAVNSYSGTSSGIIALAAAKAASLLKSKIFYTSVFVSPYIYLNSAFIGIPKLGAHGLRQIVAAGLVSKDPSKGLHVMKDITLDQIKQINEMCKNPTLINVEVQYNCNPIYCRAIAVDDKQNVVDVTISGADVNFTSIKVNNKESLAKAEKLRILKESGFKNDDQVMGYLSVKEAYELAKSIPLDDLRFLQDHIETNVKFCEAGMKMKDKRNVYNHLNKSIQFLSSPEHGFDKKHWSTSLIETIVAGIDARMGGCPLPTVTSAMNGDHGIVAIVMPYLYGQSFHITKEKVYQSILFSEFVTWKISIKIGKLCTMCGTVVAAVAGALAGIALQNDMPWEQLQNLLNMHLAQNAGTMCYGSSPACAFQVLCAVASGLNSYSLVEHGGKVPHRDGIVNDDFEITLNNLKQFTRETRDVTINNIVGSYEKQFNKKGK